MKTLALFGTCGHQDGVLDELVGAPDVEFVGVAPVTKEDNPSRILKRNAFTQKGKLYASPEALLSEVKPDIALVAPRFDQMGRISRLAAEAGCHVLSEKPLAQSLEELEELWGAVTGAGVQCGSLLANEGHPILAAARAVIGRGALGEVVLLNARKSYRFGERPEWFGVRELYGGTIPWIGIHALDFVYSVTGKRFVRVSARHANLGHPERPGCEDACVMQLELEGGALATASLDYFRPACASTHGDDWLRVVGTRGVLEAAMEGGACRVIAPEFEGSGEEAPVPRGPVFLEWLRGLSPRGTRGAPDAATRRAFLLTQASLVARESADGRGQTLEVPVAAWG